MEDYDKPASRRFFLILLAMMMLVATMRAQGQTGRPAGPQGGPPADGRGGEGFGSYPHDSSKAAHSQCKASPVLR